MLWIAVLKINIKFKLCYVKQTIMKKYLHVFVSFTKKSQKVFVIIISTSLEFSKRKQINWIYIKEQLFEPEFLIFTYYQFVLQKKGSLIPLSPLLWM